MDEFLIYACRVLVDPSRERCLTDGWETTAKKDVKMMGDYCVIGVCSTLVVNGRRP